ncbi:flavodoxin [Promicromonospora sp. AC04]|uniref:flavodoxin n=1 Tax=Promicromonospora sp. AC04 TaxID=2135723 RepID=UPI000D352403|nr:flavodoxin [Promicromonospora sp. AC04]PUB25935.1 flavodoxin [Promicromonospora sp. AC04]
MTQLDRRTFVRSALTLAGAGLVASAAGCSPSPTPGQTASQTPSEDPTVTETPDATRGRALLAYFSRAGENYYYGDRIDLTTGNTAVVAGIMADLVDLDVYEIEAADPYPEAYEATVQRNVREQESDARPEIAGALPDLAGYDVVLLGSGVWNVRAPMIMRTFVESFDLTGKTVFPVVTYAVSGMGQVADEYAELCAGATIGEGLAVQGEEAEQSRPDVEDWLRRVGLLTS